MDTTQAIAVLNATGDAGVWVQSFTQVYLPAPVIGELLFGALNSQRPSENLQRVKMLVERCSVLNVTATTAEFYAHIRLQLKRKGKPIPENDLWIAALCVEHGVPLATSDAHFLEIEGLQVIMR